MIDYKFFYAATGEVPKPAIDVVAPDAAVLDYALSLKPHVEEVVPKVTIDGSHVRRPVRV